MLKRGTRRQEWVVEKPVLLIRQPNDMTRMAVLTKDDHNKWCYTAV